MSTQQFAPKIPFATEGDLPGRFLKPITAYVEGALSMPAFLLLAQAAAAGLLASYNSLDVAWQALLLAMGVDFITGTGAALCRHTFTLRAMWEGALAKAMVFLLVWAIDSVAGRVGGGEWFSMALRFSFAIIDTGSTLRNFRRARIKLPPWLESVVSQIEERMNKQMEERTK